MRDAEAEAKGDRRARRIGEFIEALGQGVGLGGLAEGCLLTVRARLATLEDPTTLIVVRAAGKEGGRVAFVGAYNLADAFLAWRERAKNGRMKWREDIPWGER